jgi:hypothetical protein
MRMNKVHDFLSSVALRIFLLTMLAAAVLTLPRITATAETVTLAQCPAGSHQTAGECIPDVVHAAEGTDTTAEDVAAEGTDVLPVSFHAAPADLWNALREQHPATYDDDVPGIGTFWIEVGTTVNVPGGLYLATLDGWMGCADGITFGGECSATGPVLPLDIEPVPATVIYGADELAQCSTDAQCAALDADRALAGLVKADELASTDAPQVLNVAHSAPVADTPVTFSRQCVRAAKSILWAHRVGIRVEEDLSYRGMPNRVAACNDKLATAFYADRHDFTGRHGKALRTFLRHVVKTGQAPQVQMPGKVRAEDGSWVPAEDGSWVPADYYANVTGPSQALCDAYGKKRVPDAQYGHRCV